LITTWDFNLSLFIELQQIIVPKIVIVTLTNNDWLTRHCNIQFMMTYLLMKDIELLPKVFFNHYQKIWLQKWNKNHILYELFPITFSS